MELIIQSKSDILKELHDLKQDLMHIRTSHFANGIVTKERWEASPTAVITFRKSKIPMQQAAGVMKDPSEFEYGWHFPNVYYAKVSEELKDADKTLAEILNYLKDCRIRQKAHSFTDEELSLFSVIQGGGGNSWLVSHLMGGDDIG